ncbi:MAG: B12-binding domain-containing radical SAM protein [Chitinophagales bacterium]|nr:B12-binding domain-containing radical SAM protein [Chitinophagales bacterium]
MKIKNSKVDIVFVQPMDMFSAVPYVKTLTHISLLRQNGYQVKLIDPAPLKLSLNNIIQLILKYDPKVLIVSAYPSTLPFAYELTNQLYQKSPNLSFVLEGYHINADPTIIKEMHIKYGLRGDSEYTLLHLCNHLIRNEELDDNISGLVIKNGKDIIDNKHAVINDINILPMPAFELMAYGKYFSASTNKKIMWIFTTRGCPYDCDFCAFAAQKSYKYLSEDNIICQLKFLVDDLKYEWLEFMDLTFTIQKKRIIQLCNRIISEKIIFDWGCETRADLVDKEILTIMKSAGCKKITFGVETGDEELRFKTGKKITNKQFLIAFNLCQELGIKTMANFIIGHPGETVEQVEESIDFSKKINSFNVFFTRMTPLPDVDIYFRAVKKGEIKPDIWVRYMKGEIEHPVYYTPSIPQKQIEKLYKKALYTYYFRWDTIKKYLPLFKDIRYFLKVIFVFSSFTFGKPKFK